MYERFHKKMGSSDATYPWPWTVNVESFVTIKPWLWEEERSRFNIWREQMVCLLESQDLLGFVDGKILSPTDTAEEHERKTWKRRDRLVKGWILGSIGDDALACVWEKETAREVWLELEKSFCGGGDADQFGRSPNLPSKTSLDVFPGGDLNRNKLHKAALRGDWKTAKIFFDEDEDNMKAPISHLSDTALHVAVSTGKANYDFVNKLVELMPAEALSLSNISGDTALHCAAMVGNKEAAMTLVNKNPNLLYTFNKYNRLPVNEAAVFGHKETLKHLMSCMSSPNIELDGELGIRLLNSVIASEFFDVALDMVCKYPYLVRLTDHNYGASALSTIAKIRSTFLSGENFSWWQNLIYRCLPLKQLNSEAAQATPVAADIENTSCNAQIYKNYTSSFRIIRRVGHKLESIILSVLVYLAKDIGDKKTMHQQALQLVRYLCQQIASLPQIEASTMFQESIVLAAENGISEIVEVIMEMYPTVTFAEDGMGRNVFLLAATYRFENVVNLIYNMSDRKYMIYDRTDRLGNNLMHICGKVAPPDRLNLVPGAALQMQRELQWFKEMEKYVHPSRRSWENRENKTPKMLFTEEHQQLKANGEKWMKGTATACNIAAALIATVMFAAAFTVPGGAATKTTNPVFWEEFALYVFAISDAISLFTSITSLLMFLSILTSRYAEQDFLKVLPERLTIGLLSLFISITFMLAAFCATMYLVFREKLPWILIPVAAFACLPVTSFVLLQFPLLVEVVYSTYGPGIFGNKTNRPLY